MNARELLEYHEEILLKANALQRDLAMLKRQKGSLQGELYEKRLTRLQADQRKIKRRVTASQARLNHLMKQLDDPVLHQVLSLRYISLTSHAQIGTALHFSVRHIHRLQLRGILALDSVLTGQS